MMMLGPGRQLELVELSPGVRRLLAPNPSMMTGPGTNTYLLGHEEIIVIDPGPIIDSHIEKIVEVAGAPIRSVLVTHTHPDHSPAACLLAESTGAELMGRPPPQGLHQDATFVPDRILEDNDVVVVDDIEIRAITTPGHASNHVCFLHDDLNWVFTGDHIIDGSTVVIDPPDGNMGDYLASLVKIKNLRPAALLPGHGELIIDADRAINWTVDHRLKREADILAALAAHPDSTSLQLVTHVYKHIDQKLFALAERSLLAHLLKLADDGEASESDGKWSRS